MRCIFLAICLKPVSYTHLSLIAEMPASVALHYAVLPLRLDNDELIVGSEEGKTWKWNQIDHVTPRDKDRCV